MARVRIPYKPRYPEVHEALAGARFNVLVAHRRFGKTVLAVNHLIREAARCPREGGHFGYVAPFRNQAKSVAWDYLKKFSRPIPGLKVNESELAVTFPARGGVSRVRIFGADKPDALRGLYFDGIVLDEVAQMKPEVWEEIVQPALADRQGWALFIGTPKGINLFSTLYFHALKEQEAGGSDWAAMSYPCTKTSALPAHEVERLRQELSENKFRQEMLCDFTASSDDTLLTLDDVNQAFSRVPDMKLASQWPLVLGVDIARFGGDSTVFFPRQGNAALAPLVLNKKSNVDVAQRLIAWINEHQPAIVAIDQGQGTGVIDIVRDLCPPSCAVHEIPFGSKALQDKKYFNRRAEIWHSMATWVKAGGCLPDTGNLKKILLAELTAPIYSYDPTGRIKLEAKEEIKKRLNHSTDLGDALALTFAIPVSPMLVTPKKPRAKKKVYDPFA